MKKNDLVQVRIEDMGVSGEGIGKIDGFALFVKDAVIGDLVEVKIMKVKKNYAYAKLERILEPSPHRVDPLCKMHRQCGGCQVQALDYQEQLRFKENKVKNHLQRLGGFANISVNPIIGMETPYYYRNKAQFPFGTDKEGNPITGFYAGRTHSIIPNTQCHLGVDKNQIILEKILDYMKQNNVKAYDEASGTGLIRHVLIRVGFVTKEIMVSIVINGRKVPKTDTLIKSLCEIEGMTSISLNVNQEKTNVILGQELIFLWGKDYITDYIGDIKYQISPLSFYQVNPVQTEELYKTALEYAGLTGKETVWDLYCGIGTISLFLAQRAKEVYGVELIPQAIEDARRNAALNGMDNVKFFIGKAEEVLPEQYEKNHVYADVIVVDPPRKGCDETLLNTIVQMQPQRVVYVSCDSATLARDLRYLAERGYEIRSVQPVDMFPATVHVETVVLMTK